jgi:erythromycin esterase
MLPHVRWLAEKKFPGQKIVLWAYNGHVQAALSEGLKPMGAHLRDTYGPKMVILGFASYAGTVRAVPIADGKWQRDKLGALPLEPAKPSSIDGLFEQTGLPRFILDLRRVRAGSALATWMAKPRQHRSIGAGFDPANASHHYQETDLPKAFDGLIFVSQVAAAKPLP